MSTHRADQIGAAVNVKIHIYCGVSRAGHERLFLSA